MTSKSLTEGRPSLPRVKRSVEPQPDSKPVAYMASYIKRSIFVDVMGREIEMPLSGMAEGCVGVSLWFDSVEHAQEWAGDDSEIKMATYVAQPQSTKKK